MEKLHKRVCPSTLLRTTLLSKAQAILPTVRSVLHPFSRRSLIPLAGYEYDPGPDGRITWAINGSQTWELNASAMGPDEEAQIGQRLVSEEPMVSLAVGTEVGEEFANLGFDIICLFEQYM